MKKLMILILALLLSLAACTAASVTTATLPPVYSHLVTPYTPPRCYTPPDYLSSPTPSPAESVSPAPSFVPDTDIPDIIIPNEDPAENSNHDIYEDDKYVYSLIEGKEGGYYLCGVSKSNGNTTRITEDYCICFTLYKGIVYYVESGHSGAAIISYDPVTNRSKQIKALKNNVYNIAANNGRLYFTYVTVYDEEAEAPLTDLYSIKLNGGDKKIIAEDVCTFCIYENFIYFTSTEGSDGAPVYECRLDGSGRKQLFDWAVWDFEISRGRLYYNFCIYNENDYSTKDFIGAIDLDTLEKTDILEGYYDFALLGQYLFYITADNMGNSYLYACDADTGKIFNLIELGPGQYRLNTGSGCVYISWEADFGTHIAKAAINNGQALLIETIIFQPEV